jgi:Flp pilus assembly protein TadD
VAAAAGVACLLPYVVSRDYASAAAAAVTRPAAAETTLAAAHRLDPWNASVVALQGDIALRGGDPQLAAKRYAEAARLSAVPWVATFSEAAALRRAGSTAAADAACRRAAAANPLEPLLRRAPCNLSPSRWQT